MRLSIDTVVGDERVTVTGEAWLDEGPEGVSGGVALVDGEWPDDVRQQLEGELAAEYELRVADLLADRAERGA